MNEKPLIPTVEDENIIEDLKLTQVQVLRIVSEWYTNGMYPDILQNEDGLDLEEICYEEITEILEISEEMRLKN